MKWCRAHTKRGRKVAITVVTVGGRVHVSILLGLGVGADSLRCVRTAIVRNVVRTTSKPAEYGEEVAKARAALRLGCARRRTRSDLVADKSAVRANGPGSGEGRHDGRL